MHITNDLIIKLNAFADELLASGQQACIGTEPLAFVKMSLQQVIGKKRHLLGDKIQQHPVKQDNLVTILKRAYESPGKNLSYNSKYER